MKQDLHAVQSWIGMWCLGKYKNKNPTWRGWWIARLLNRQNDAGRSVNLMVEVTTCGKKPQDSPPQDFEEIYLLDMTEKESALEAIKLLTPLLGDIRNKSSRNQALKDVHAACGRTAPVMELGNSDTQSDCDASADEKCHTKAPQEDRREHAENTGKWDEGAKRLKLAGDVGDSHSASKFLTCMQSTMENTARWGGDSGRERRERKPVARLDPAEAAEKDRLTKLARGKRKGQATGRGGATRFGTGLGGSRKDAGAHGAPGALLAPGWLLCEPAPSAQADDVVWRTAGSEYVGKRVRRSLWSNGDAADSRIIGILQYVHEIL
jgi:hypothetical protein